MASASPMAVVRLRAKTDTSAKSVKPRSTAVVPMIAKTPIASGSTAAVRPPNTQMRSRKLIGIATASATNRSRLVCSLTCE